MIPEERLHEEAYRVRKIVFAKLLDPGDLKDFLFFDFIILERGLLQNVHEDLERLIHLPAQTIDHIAEEIRFIDDFNTRSSILQTPGDILGIESFRTANRGTQHQFSDARVL